MVIRFTKEQQKIIYIAIAALVFLLCFWFLIYLPQGKKAAYYKEELAKTESQIAEIVGVAKDRDLAQYVKELNTEFNQMISRLPHEDQDVIAYLSESAKNSKVTVKNILPSPIQPIDVKISKYVISEFPLTLNLECEYRELGEYLYALEHDFPILVKINSLSIKGGGEGRYMLNATLELSAFLSQRK